MWLISLIICSLRSFFFFHGCSQENICFIWFQGTRNCRFVFVLPRNGSSNYHVLLTISQPSEATSLYLLICTTSEAARQYHAPQTDVTCDSLKNDEPVCTYSKELQYDSFFQSLSFSLLIGQCWLVLVMAHCHFTSIVSRPVHSITLCWPAVKELTLILRFVFIR